MPDRRDEITDALRQRVVAGLHLAVLRPGERLPSVRDLSPEFDADPRVVLAAYRRLELEGLVEIRPRSGVFVAHHAVSRGELLPRTAAWVVDVLVQARSRGISPIDFPERVRRCLETVRVRAACIECNDDQMEGLCGELAKDYGMETYPVDTAALSAEAQPPELRDADLLVTTPFHAPGVERLAKRLDKRCITVSLRPEFVAETTRLLTEGRVYFVGKDPRFESKLKAIFASTPGAENLRVLIVGRDDLSQIPENAPTYVMRAARDRLEELSLLARVIPAPRIFSDESARDLLSFVIGSNVAALAEAENRGTDPVDTAGQAGNKHQRG
jgi:DNA-binding transcriptional regulator YhcF (GntR family)